MEYDDSLTRSQELILIYFDEVLTLICVTELFFYEIHKRSSTIFHLFSDLNILWIMCNWSLHREAEGIWSINFALYLQCSNTNWQRFNNTCSSFVRILNSMSVHQWHMSKVKNECYHSWAKILYVHIKDHVLFQILRVRLLNWKTKISRGQTWRLMKLQVIIHF